MAGTLAKQSSKLAAQKAGNAKVKQFAGFEVAEQTAIAQALTSQLSLGGAALDNRRAKVLQDLQAASGAQFDKAYVAAQIDGHSELLGIQDAFLKNKGQDTASLLASNTAHIATFAKAVVEMHLAALKDLNEMLRASPKAAIPASSRVPVAASLSARALRLAVRAISRNRHLDRYCVLFI